MLHQRLKHFSPDTFQLPALIQSTLLHYLYFLLLANPLQLKFSAMFQKSLFLLECFYFVSSCQTDLLLGVQGTDYYSQ